MSDQELQTVEDSPRWVRLWLGEIPIWIEAGAIERGVAERAALLSTALRSAPAAKLGLSLVTFRAALPGILHLLMDATRWLIDLGWLDLPKPQPPRKADPLVYFASWAVSGIVESLTAFDWQATYAETPDGGCQITGLAPRTVPAPAAADTGGGEADAGGDPPADAAQPDADPDRAGSTLGDSGRERDGQDDVRQGADPAVPTLPPLGADLRA